jgi:hypothetical protein
MRRYAIVPTCIAAVLSCAPHRIPQQLRGYDVVVERRDEQSRELARALKEAGFRVRDRLRGGSRPTLALMYFTFAETGPGEPTWLHIRLADTRSGVILGAGMVVLDSLATTARARATAAVQSLIAP